MTARALGGRRAHPPARNHQSPRAEGRARHPGRALRLLEPRRDPAARGAEQREVPRPATGPDQRPRSGGDVRSAGGAAADHLPEVGIPRTGRRLLGDPAARPEHGRLRDRHRERPYREALRRRHHPLPAPPRRHGHQPRRAAGRSPTWSSRCRAGRIRRSAAAASCRGRRPTRRRCSARSTTRSNASRSRSSARIRSTSSGAVRWIATDEKFFLLAAVPYPESPPHERGCAATAQPDGTRPGHPVVRRAERCRRRGRPTTRSPSSPARR